MPLPLTVSCFSKIQIGFTFLVLAHLGSPGKRAVKRVCVCVLVVSLLLYCWNVFIIVVQVPPGECFRISSTRCVLIRGLLTTILPMSLHMRSEFLMFVVDH